MSRITTPATIQAAPTSSQPLLEAVKRQLGSAPNLFRVVANSPAALEGYLGLNAALGKGALAPATRERVALAVAAANECDYCLAAHTALGKGVKLDEAELEANRHGRSNDAKADAAVRFVTQVVQARGHVSDAQLQAVKAAGYSEPEVIELVVHVALNTLTNYVNSVAQTDLDFPRVERRAA
jgi:uncharacterized peroxidase-related enzyme